MSHPHPFKRNAMPVLLRVLIVDDSPDDTLLLVNALKAGGYKPQFTRVDTASSMREALAVESWELVLADFALPHFSGPEALQVLHESRLDLPFIVVSGKIGEEQAVAMMKAGAHVAEAEKALRESQQQLQANIDNSLAVIFMKDIAGRYGIVSLKFGRIDEQGDKEFL